MVLKIFNPNLNMLKQLNKKPKSVAKKVISSGCNWLESWRTKTHIIANMPDEDAAHKTAEKPLIDMKPENT